MHEYCKKMVVLGAVVPTVFFVFFFINIHRTFAADRHEPEFFREGSMRLSVLVGSGTAFGETYTIVGAGLGYYFWNDLEAGFEYESWLGGDRGISRLAPQLTYIIPASGTARPYAGVFYRRSFIQEYKDKNDAGARAGILFLYGRKAYIGVGAVYERHLGCDLTVYDSCSDAYPELVVAVMF